MLPHTAQQVMTRSVISVRKGTSIEEALRIMSSNHISGLPVVDVDGRLIGIITETDVLLRGQTEVDSGWGPFPGTVDPQEDHVTEAYRKARAARVEEGMSRDVVAFAEESSVVDIARVMVERKINRVPIIRDGKVVGIISRGDIIKSMAALEFNGAGEDTSAGNSRITL